MGVLIRSRDLEVCLEFPWDKREPTNPPAPSIYQEIDRQIDRYLENKKKQVQSSMSNHLQTYSLYTALDLYLYCSIPISILLQISVYTALDQCQYCSRLYIYTALDYISILLQTWCLYCFRLYVYTALDYMSILLQANIYILLLTRIYTAQDY